MTPGRPRLQPLTSRRCRSVVARRRDVPPVPPADAAVPRRALVAAAHGTRDPNGRVAIEALLAQVRRARPGIVAVPAYLGHAHPSLPDAVAMAGGRPVVVPLLLSRGHHIAADISSVAGRARLARPLGPDPLLATVLRDRLRGAGFDGGSVVLAAAGSSDPDGREDVLAQAAMLGDVAVGVLSGVGPTVVEQVARLPRPVAVASYLLTRGRFHRRLAEVGADVVTAPLAPHPELVRLVLRRYDEAVP